VSSADEFQQSLTDLDNAIAALADATDLASRERLASALCSKVDLLRAEDLKQEATLVCDEILLRFGTAPGLALREYVAWALCTKGELGEWLVDHVEAAAAYGALLAHFRNGESKSIDENLRRARARKRYLTQHHHWGA
jgi:hypothetical protein